MRSALYDVLPLQVRRSLKKFGEDLNQARRKRRLTVAMMAERLGISKGTYARVEKGDPSVALGAYAMALFVFGIDDGFHKLLDPGQDYQGLLLDAEHLPKRIRKKKLSKS